MFVSLSSSLPSPLCKSKYVKDLKREREGEKMHSRAEMSCCRKVRFPVNRLPQPPCPSLFTSSRLFTSTFIRTAVHRCLLDPIWALHRTRGARMHLGNLQSSHRCLVGGNRPKEGMWLGTVSAAREDCGGVFPRRFSLLGASQDARNFPGGAAKWPG